MAPQGSAKKNRAASAGTVVRYGALVVAISVMLAGGIYGSQQFQQFLIRDTRFFLPGPAGSESSGRQGVRRRI